MINHITGGSCIAQSCLSCFRGAVCVIDVDLNSSGIKVKLGWLNALCIILDKPFFKHGFLSSTFFYKSLFGFDIAASRILPAFMD